MPTSGPREFSLLKISLVAAALLTVGAFRAHAQASGPPANRWSPPWQHGANNDAVDRGLEFTEPDADNLADFHGSPMHPKLVLYVGGNYFFAMAPLVQTFEALHPQYKARIYWETIPPGLLMRQLKAGAPSRSAT